MGISVRNWDDFLKQLQSTFQVPSLFLNYPGMKSNPKKLAVASFPREKCSPLTGQLQGHVIPTVTSYRFSGAPLDRSFSWSRHVLSLEEKLNELSTSSIAWLARLLWYYRFITSTLRFYCTEKDNILCQYRYASHPVFMSVCAVRSLDATVCTWKCLVRCTEIS